MYPRPLGLLLGALGVGLVLSLVAFVWPTPYRYETTSYHTYQGGGVLETRTNRITGRQHIRRSKTDPWRELEDLIR